MQKIQKLALAFVAASSVLSTSAFAADSQFYITAGGGVLFKSKQLSNFNTSYKTTAITGTYPNTTVVETATENTFTLNSPKNGGEMFVGVGYYVTDKIRAEAVFVKPWFGKEAIAEANKITTTTNTTTTTADTKITTTAKTGPTAVDKDYVGKLTSQINSAQVRWYYDAFDIADMGKAYVGAGIGWAQVKAKFNTDDPAINTVKTKNSNNFAWSVAVGAAFDVVEAVKLGLEYNYQDFGNVQNKLVVPVGAAAEAGNNAGKIRFHGHAIVAKLMFKI